jgi:hypothetical protein
MSDEPMERTPLREAFFAEIRKDPYAWQCMKLYTEGWVAGYKQALKDWGDADVMPHDVTDTDDLNERAFAYLTASKRRVENIIDVAALGPLVARGKQSDPPSDPPCPVHTDGRHNYEEYRTDGGIFYPYCACGKRWE